jgi:hypothetical protein
MARAVDIGCARKKHAGPTAIGMSPTLSFSFWRAPRADPKVER